MVDATTKEEISNLLIGEIAKVKSGVFENLIYGDITEVKFPSKK